MRLPTHTLTQHTRTNEINVEVGYGVVLVVKVDTYILRVSSFIHQYAL